MRKIFFNIKKDGEESPNNQSESCKGQSQDVKPLSQQKQEVQEHQGSSARSKL